MLIVVTASKKEKNNIRVQGSSKNHYCIEIISSVAILRKARYVYFW